MMICSRCRRELDNFLFLKNDETDEYYKTCEDCRSKKKERRRTREYVLNDLLQKCKKKDLKHDRFNEDQFITYDILNRLFDYYINKNERKCFYYNECKTIMKIQWEIDDYGMNIPADLATMERIYDEDGYTIYNTTLCCRGCNGCKRGDIIEEEICSETYNVDGRKMCVKMDNDGRNFITRVEPLKKIENRKEYNRDKQKEWRDRNKVKLKEQYKLKTKL